MEVYSNGGYNTDWWSSDQCMTYKQDELTQGISDPERAKIQQETKNTYNSY